MKKILLSIAAALIGISGLFAATPVFAMTAEECEAAGGVYTAILGEDNCVINDSDGSGIKGILNLVLDVMTVIAGIVGAIGITVVGIQYLTAADSEEKVRKSKRRMFEIILGFVAYILIYALLKWLGVANS